MADRRLSCRPCTAFSRLIAVYCGTGIRTLGWHGPSRLSTDLMRAAQRFGSLRRFVASQCDLAQGSDAGPAIGKRFLPTELEAKASAFDLPESGTIVAWSRRRSKDVKLLDVALGGGSGIRKLGWYEPSRRSVARCAEETPAQSFLAR